MKKVESIVSVEKRITKNNKPFWCAFTDQGEEVYCWDEVHVGQKILYDSRNDYLCIVPDV